MDLKNKFTADTVRQLQQSLDAVAPYQETELSKQQAIRSLSPQIFALRSKGYNWTAVAAMLSERGVPVSVAALRTYLRRVRAEAADEAPRAPTKRLRDSRTHTLPPERLSTIAPSSSPSGETAATTKPQQSVAAGASVPTVQPATVSGTRREQDPRRSTFAGRRDTDEI